VVFFIISTLQVCVVDAGCSGPAAGSRAARALVRNVLSGNPNGRGGGAAAQRWIAARLLLDGALASRARDKEEDEDEKEDEEEDEKRLRDMRLSPCVRSPEPSIALVIFAPHLFFSLSLSLSPLFSTSFMAITHNRNPLLTNYRVEFLVV